MARQEGTLKLTSNLEAKFNAPLDARTVVRTKEDLYTLPYTYRGLEVYVIDEGERYELINDLPQYEASWKPKSTGEYNFVEMSDAEIDALFV